MSPSRHRRTAARSSSSWSKYTGFPEKLVSLSTELSQLAEKSPQSAETTWFLTITEQAVDDCLVIAVAGRIGAAAAPRVAEALRGAGRRGSRIVLELSGVDYISSPGVAAIEQSGSQLREEGKTLVVRGAQGAARLCLDLARVPHE